MKMATDPFLMGEHLQLKIADKEGLISSAMKTLQEDSGRIHQLLDQLGKTIAPVLGPDREMVAEPPPSFSGESPIISRLNELHYGLMGAIDRLQDLLRRVEL